MTNKLKQDQLSINNLYPPFTAPILVKGAVGRTDFCTPDKFGWGINTNNATYGGGITLVSWKEE